MCCVLFTAVVIALACAGLTASWVGGAGVSLLGLLLFQARWYRVAVDGGRDDLGPWTLLRLNLAELRATAVLGWWQLRARLGHPIHTPDPSRYPPVLLVHGFTQNHTNMWGLQRALAAGGHPSERVDLGPPTPWRRVEDYGEPLAEALERYPDGVAVVAHSMGGVVLRRVLHERPELRGRVHAAITLGSPHRGTAVHPRFVDLVQPADQLAADARWLITLPSLPALLPGKSILTIGSSTDMVVYPESTTRQRGAPHIRLDDVGHAGLLTRGEVHDVVITHLERCSPPSTGSAD